MLNTEDVLRKSWIFYSKKCNVCLSICVDWSGDWVVSICALLLLSWFCFNKCVKCQDFSKSQSLTTPQHWLSSLVLGSNSSKSGISSEHQILVVGSVQPPPLVLAQVYHCVVIHDVGAEMQLGVLGTEIMWIPGHIQDARIGELFLLTQRRYRQAWLAEHGGIFGLDADHWPDQVKTVSGMVTGLWMTPAGWQGGGWCEQLT